MKKLKNEELNRLSVDEFRRAEKIPLVLILDDIRSLNNVGSAFRTADAFLLEKIFLCGITGQPPHREINKTALGATESVSWEYHENAMPLVKNLKENGYWIVTVEQVEQGTPLQKFLPGHLKLALIFGNEINGVKEELIRLSDTIIEIPQFGTKHSLNISVSIGIVIWDLICKLKLVKG
ncbi:MAG: TrmH family RNA methyltransferase [Cyclobacteriaceae bacterium]|nr:TrmH family RNA methyltransferase [Cyclobacteriaceae bacterium]